MKILRSLLSILLLIIFTNYAFASSPPISNSLAPMLQKALPAIINIKANIKITDLATLNRIQREKGIDPNNPQQQQIPDTFVSVGSGVIIDADKGFILTNAHVVNDAQIIIVTLSDGRHFSAKLIGLDKLSDIALIQIKAKKLTAIPLSSSSTLKVGDVVAAIGNPFGLSQTVTSGIVSALGRASLGIEALENFIQTDAPINPGNSGGALLDTEGNLVGINTAILAPEKGSVGIGFAIPANIAKSVMDQLIKYGNVSRGTLGIGAQDITPDLATAFKLNNTEGAVVTLVMLNSPAQKAGLQVGDIITSINGIPIKKANDVANTIGFSRVESKVNISILRDNKSTTLNATLTDPKELKKTNEARDPFLFGLSLKDFTLSSPLHGDIQGVVVVTVEPDSNAWQADLMAGDVITSANKKRVTSVEELKKAASEAKDTLLLNVLRGSGAIFLVINKEQN